MPELPEVEVVRAGLERHVAGRTVDRVEVLHPRAVRRHVPGPVDFASRLSGRRFDAARRRGKYLWIELDGAADAVVAHLGMSGQMLVQPVGTPDETHLRVRVRFADDGPELRFVDQRTFGGLALTELVAGLPVPIAHIGRDPLDAEFDLATGVAALRARRTEVKRALLDQTVVSGIGNIYADEALWRTKLHWSRPANGLTKAKATELLEAATDVMREALVAGGTSFDALYVNVNGQSGYFDRSLAAYGQENRPCGRCGTAIIRESFMNRSSFSCPKCQRAPR
ncbi:bifunctional DNA-formamidopyrimidine glycosylase/DNA-(apurinic or apyrimidinic site) lyase [Allokutzneria sp. A3M-2-11 16]|uniref:bifunctional DNA-formamidopyrimidine glycosylase/DNA-(apurinic or apyrimidinic site) lyase n=1 Tax=Allokutzneria sp. A3M-2-11 16 TaxID=2962043 RepID=UPI0020B8749D|nr:bifunctional DNA-formamidopyrimidine glycosylase/DNA-(apurinic or apyrimidinic site) lyase [Allokutzneria sp. A3M-2-11 16]MCP3798031.1 bifunctional DNA-formamidopyrimidine glycosylase/DNA-(apurinic or apyrimidinic site) lyase [Allokutzneria sp. A3M-2-11 16]